MQHEHRNTSQLNISQQVTLLSTVSLPARFFFFFLNDPPPPEFYPLPHPAALPTSGGVARGAGVGGEPRAPLAVADVHHRGGTGQAGTRAGRGQQDELAAAEITAARAELLDQLPVVRLDVGRHLGHKDHPSTVTAGTRRSPCPPSGSRCPPPRSRRRAGCRASVGCRCSTGRPGYR